MSNFFFCHIVFKVVCCRGVRYYLYVGKEETDGCYYPFVTEASPKVSLNSFLPAVADKKPGHENGIDKLMHKQAANEYFLEIFWEYKNLCM